MTDNDRRQPLDPATEDAIARFARERGGTAQAGGQAGAAYDGVARLWDDLEELRSDPAILTAREAALARHRPWRAAWRSPAMARTAVACLGLLLAVGGAWAVMREHAARPETQPVRQAAVQQFRTRVGQISGVALPDGSLAILDTGTTIRFRDERSNGRRVDLVDGRALFKVAKIAGRPFRVAIGETTLTALGTKFDVLRTRGGFDVNLVEGKLRVARALSGEGDDGAQEQQLVMLAGDRLMVTPGRWLLTRGMAERNVDWSKGQLVFDNAPVADVVAMLNRYTERKMTIADPALATQRISAVIRTDDPLMLVDALVAMGIGQGRDSEKGVELIAL